MAATKIWTAALFPPLLFLVLDAMAKRGADEQTETKAAEKAPHSKMAAKFELWRFVFAQAA